MIAIIVVVPIFGCFTVNVLFSRHTVVSYIFNINFLVFFGVKNPNICVGQRKSYKFIKINPPFNGDFIVGIFIQRGSNVKIFIGNLTKLLSQKSQFSGLIVTFLCHQLKTTIFTVDERALWSIHTFGNS